jgi:adenylate cyclase
MVKTVKVREAELERFKDSFARFFPEDYLRFLRKDSVIDVQLGDFVSKTMAVMFSDIRSFTTISESMTPRENFDFINAYLKRVSPEIRNHYGIIVKFLGDGMMAVFPDGADDAIAAGIAKHQRVSEYNQQRTARGDRPIQIGIGIHVGRMMLGMVGESNRIQGDAFSDNVNLTARLEGLTKVYGSALLITGQTLEQLSNPEAYQVRFLANTLVKGRTEPIAVYEVLNAEVEAIQTLKLQTLPEFEQGIAYFNDRAFTEAKRCFEKVLTIHSDDRTARLYCDRIDPLLSQGIPDDWKNVWSLDK